jgi:CheY-like chemotaxis protein
MDGEMVEAGAPEADSSARGMILHVEDDDDTRRTTGTFLRLAGFEVCEAASAFAALAQLEALKNRLDVLIVDYHLGGEMTGTEVAESLVQLVGHGVPTVILTGDPTNAEMPWLRNSPIWLVRKPASPATLVGGLWPLVAFAREMRRLGGI